MELLLQYLPYLIVAGLSWAMSSRSGIWLPVLDPSTTLPVPQTGRPIIDLVLNLVWRLLPDDKTRELVAKEAFLIKEALDHYNVNSPLQPKPPS